MDARKRRRFEGMPSLVLELHPVDVEPGAWCQACLLPSAVRVSMVAVDSRSLQPVMRCTVLACEQCGWHTLVTPDPG